MISEGAFSDAHLPEDVGGQRRRAARRIGIHHPVETLVEARRLLGECDDAVLRTRRLLDIAGDGKASVVWYREARQRAELLESYSRELAEVLKTVEHATREQRGATVCDGNQLGSHLL